MHSTSECWKRFNSYNTLFTHFMFFTPATSLDIATPSQLHYSPHPCTTHHTPVLLTIPLNCSPHPCTAHHTPVLLTTPLYCSPHPCTAHHTPVLLTTPLYCSPHLYYSRTLTTVLGQHCLNAAYDACIRLRI